MLLRIFYIGGLLLIVSGWIVYIVGAVLKATVYIEVGAIGLILGGAITTPIALLKRSQSQRKRANTLTGGAAN